MLSVLLLCNGLQTDASTVDSTVNGSHLVRPSGTAHNDSEGTCNSDVCINYLECGLCSAFRTPTGSAATGLGFCWAIFSIRTIDNTANNKRFAFAPPQLFVEQSGRFAESQSSDFDRYVAGPFGAVDTTLSSRQYLRYSKDALIAAIVRCGAMSSTEDFTLAYDNPGGVSVRAVKATPPPPFWKNPGNCKVFTDFGSCQQIP